MLESLDNAAWSDLPRVPGPAADVPALLRALLSTDAGQRSAARSTCYDVLLPAHGQAGARAVPFLLEMLAAPATPDRAELLRLVVALAVGDDDRWLPGGSPLAPAHAPDAPPSRRAVAEGVPLYLSLLDDPQAPVRKAAAYALGWFPERAAAAVPGLTWAALDEDESVAATAVLSLGLAGADDPLAAKAAEAAFDGSRETVRGAAAIALARLHGPTVQPAVLEELSRWAAEGRRADVPHLGGDLGAYAERALRARGGA